MQPVVTIENDDSTARLADLIRGPSLRDRPGNAARARALEHSTASAMAEQYLSMYADRAPSAVRKNSPTSARVLKGPLEQPMQWVPRPRPPMGRA